MIKLSKGSILAISAALGIASDVIPPLAVPGLLAAALVFREGVHSDYGLAYIYLALGINFCLVGGVSYWMLRRLFCKGCVSKGVQKVAPDLPLKGIIYTESEIEEFKRRGLM